SGLGDALAAVNGHDHVEAFLVEAAHQHVSIILVVFDQKKLWHRWRSSLGTTSPPRRGGRFGTCRASRQVRNSRINRQVTTRPQRRQPRCRGTCAAARSGGRGRSAWSGSPPPPAPARGCDRLLSSA